MPSTRDSLVARMKILYSLPHPADRLADQGAGHLVRATSLLAALRELGHEIIQMEAAGSGSAMPVRAYRGLVKKVIPRPISMVMRDWGRIQYGRHYAGRLIQAAAQHRPEVILETHIAFSLAGAIASQQTGVPLALDDCAPAWEEEQQYGVGLKSQALSIHRTVTGRASLLVAVNETLHRLLVEGGAPSEKVITIQNGIDSAFLAPGIDAEARRCALGFAPGDVVIVFVGSFQPYHRIDLLLEAFQQMRDRGQARLLLVGSGQTYDASRALAASLALGEHVTFTGSVPYRDVPSYIAAGDIAVMSATAYYCNPMKMYEYMALGKPVVAPRQANIREIAADGLDSLLFEPDSAPALAEALTTLVAQPGLRQRLGAAGRQRALDQTWHNRAIALQDALSRLVRAAPPRP